MNNAHVSYARFNGRRRVEKAINSLGGMLEGIAADSILNRHEISFLHEWLDEHRPYRALHPFNELVPAIDTALKDGVLSADEKEDLQWLCSKLSANEFFDTCSADLQRLHGVLAGIAADGSITASELEGLTDWMLEHEHLKTCWPYDEVDSIVTVVLADKKVDQVEHATLLQLFTEFAAVLDDRTITSPPILENGSITGLCAVCPELKFQGATYCFTGASTKYSRSDFTGIVERLGGRVLSGVTRELDYLVIGNDGNPCWAYACYGRKVEKAVELRKQGRRLLLVHENDFHDAIADQGL